MSKYKRIPIGDLEAFHPVGSGGNGQVFKGRWKGEGNGMSVAIKQIYMDGSIPVDNLCKEAEIPSRFPSSPTICKVYGVCIFESFIWIVMQLCTDRDLSIFLASLTAPLSPSNQLWLCFCANHAVYSLHTAHPPILHRDIKSDNFFVQSNGTGLILGDYGRAQSAKESGESVGTLRWTPPEILRNDGTAWTTASDIFSLGMVFYHIVTGQLPFGDNTEEATVAQLILSGERPKIPYSCPTVLRKLIESCWSDNAELRPSAQAIYAVLTPHFFQIRSEKFTTNTPEEIRTVAADDGNSPLHEAVIRGTIYDVKKIIDAGIDVNICNAKAATPLMLAAGLNRLDVVELLLKSSAAVNMQDFEGVTALSCACWLGNSEVAQLLLEHTASVAILNDTNDFPLRYAISGGSIECIRLLAKYGASMANSGRAASSLICAISNRHTNLISELVSLGASVDQLEGQDQSPIQFAAFNNDIAAMRELIRLGANVNCRDEDGNTPLMIAPHHNTATNVEMIGLLVQHGAEVNAQDSCGATALMNAFFFRAPLCIKKLISLGARLDIKDKTGRTAFAYAT